jgi:hypothetical protein
MTNHEGRGMYKLDLPGGRLVGRTDRPPGRTAPALASPLPDVPPCRQKVSHFRRDPQNKYQIPFCLLPGQPFQGAPIHTTTMGFLNTNLGKCIQGQQCMCCSCDTALHRAWDAIIDVYPIFLLVFCQGSMRKSESPDSAWKLSCKCMSDKS